MKKLEKEAKKRRILIVDDDQEMRIFLSNLLDSGGFEPVVARNGTEGLQKALRSLPDVIFLDIPITEKDGFQMFYSLKQYEALVQIPVIMMSSLDHRMFIHYKKQQKTRSGIGSCEPDAYLKKPPESEEIFSLIKEILEPSKREHR